MAEIQKPQTNAAASDVDIGIITQIFKSQKNNNLCILFNIDGSRDISSKVLVFMNKLRTIIIH